MSLVTAPFGGKEKNVDFVTPIQQRSGLVVMGTRDGPSKQYALALVDALDTAKLYGTKQKNSPTAGLIAVGVNLDNGLTSNDFAPHDGSNLFW